MKKAILPLSLILLIASLTFAGWFLFMRGVVSTDDAYITTQKISVSPKVSGYISAVSVKADQPVKQGDTIMRIDPSDYQDKLQAAQAQANQAQAEVAALQEQITLQERVIDEAQTSINAAQNDVTLAQKTLERTNGLEGFAVSAQEVDQLKAKVADTQAALTKATAQKEAAQQQKIVLETQIKEADQAVKKAQADSALAKQQLEDTVIYAPLDGTIGPQIIQPGQLVEPGSTLTYLIPSDALWVEANFKETQITHLKPGMLASIKVDAHPDKKITGIVQSLSPASGSEFSILPSENATGNFTKIVQRIPVRIALAKDTDLSIMKPGLSCDITINTRQNMK